MMNYFGAEVDRGQHNRLSAEVDYLGGKCCRLHSLSTEVT